jgi:tetratricopeptide (TPR) repeat protein
MIRGKSRECAELADRTIALWNELGGDDLVEVARNMRACALCELDDPHGLDLLRASLAALIDSGHIENAAPAWANVGDWIWLLDGPEEGLASHREGMAFDLSRGLRGPAMWLRAEMTWMLYDLGRWDEIFPIVEEVSAFDEAEGGMQQVLLATPFAAVVHLRRGELPQAARLRDRYLDRARVATDPQVLGTWLAVDALVAGALRDAEAAAAAIRELIDVTRGRADWHRARSLPELVRLAARFERRELGRELVEPLRSTRGRPAHAIVAARAELAEAEGRLDEALALHEEAAARWEAYGRVDGRADALHGAGRCLLALGRVEEARDRLRTARAIFSGLGARPSVAEVDALLGDQPASARAAT